MGLCSIAVWGLEAQVLEVMHNRKGTRKLFNALRPLEFRRCEETSHMQRSGRPFGNGFCQHNCLGPMADYQGLIQQWLGEVIQAFTHGGDLAQSDEVVNISENRRQ
jgi:hypothetical protein